MTALQTASVKQVLDTVRKREQEFEHQLEESLKFLRGLKSPIASCVQASKKESKSTQCRRNKDRNFKRCLDLLEWEFNELSRRVGQVGFYALVYRISYHVSQCLRQLK